MKFVEMKLPLAVVQGIDYTLGYTFVEEMTRSRGGSI
jgi:hypothetical protein